MGEEFPASFATTWGNPGESSVMTSAPSQTGMRHPAHSQVIEQLWSHWRHSEGPEFKFRRPLQNYNMLSVYFLTCLIHSSFEVKLNQKRSRFKLKYGLVVPSLMWNIWVWGANVFTLDSNGHYFRSRNLALPQDSHSLRGSTRDLCSVGTVQWPLVYFFLLCSVPGV
jgi:hypothetical protein